MKNFKEYVGEDFIEFLNLENVNLIDDLDSDIMYNNSKMEDGKSKIEELIKSKLYLSRFFKKFCLGSSLINGKKYKLYKSSFKKIIDFNDGIYLNEKREVIIRYNNLCKNIINSLTLISNEKKQEYINAIDNCDNLHELKRVVKNCIKLELSSCNIAIGYSKLKNPSRFKGFEVNKEYSKLKAKIKSKTKKKEYDLYSDYLRDLMNMVNSFDIIKFDLKEIYDCYDYDQLCLLLIIKMYNYMMSAKKYTPDMDKCFNSILKYFNTVEKYKLAENSNYNPFIYDKDNNSLDYSEMKMNIINLFIKYPNYDFRKIYSLYQMNELPLTILPLAPVHQLSLGSNSYNSNGNYSSGGFSRKVSEEYLFSKKPSRIVLGNNAFKAYIGFLFDNGVMVLEKREEDNATYVINSINILAFLGQSKTQIIVNNRNQKTVERLYHRNIATWKERIDKLLSTNNSNTFSNNVTQSIDNNSTKKVLNLN